MILRFIALASLGLNLFFVYVFVETADFYLQRVPFDMQEVRSDYEYDVKQFISRACMDGTEMPPEYRINPGTGWHENSPSEWCLQRRNEYSDWIERSAKSLGRRRM